MDLELGINESAVLFIYNAFWFSDLSGRSSIITLFFWLLLEVWQTLSQSFFPICAVSDGSYLTSSGTAYRVDQKGHCCPRESAGPGCFQGSQHLLIGCVQRSTQLFWCSCVSDFMQHADAWVCRLVSPKIKDRCLQVNVKWHSRIFCFIILLYVHTGMPVTVKVRLYFPGASWLIETLWYGVWQGKEKNGTWPGIDCFYGTGMCIGEVSMTVPQ